jgi:hypothetical protein
LGGGTRLEKTFMLGKMELGKLKLLL